MKRARATLAALMATVGCASKPAPPASTAGEKPASQKTATRKSARDLPPELAAMLTRGPCEQKLQVALEHHTMKAEDAAERPKAFLIGPGEKLCLVGSPSGEGLIDPELSQTPVSLESAAQHLISVELAMLDMGAVLVVKNHHDRPLSYRAVVKAPGHEPEASSVCTVMANLTGIEHWPNEIEAVMFGDFKLLEPSETPECR